MRTEQIKTISNMCTSNYGSLLLQLMDFCNKNSLSEVSDEEAEDFLNKLNNGEIKPAHFNKFYD